MLGDKENVAINVGLLSMYAMIGSMGSDPTSKINISPLGTDPTKLIIICPISSHISN